MFYLISDAFSVYEIVLFSRLMLLRASCAEIDNITWPGLSINILLLFIVLLLTLSHSFMHFVKIIDLFFF